MARDIIAEPLTNLINSTLIDCHLLQRFSELCENLRVPSHQILTSELTDWKPRLRNHCSSCNNISNCISKHPPFYVTGDSLSQVRFPTCQFYQSKFDVTRPCNFHKVLKTSVPLRKKVATVTPVFKKDDKLSTKNYRSVSVLNVFSKVFGRVTY